MTGARLPARDSWLESRTALEPSPEGSTILIVDDLSENRRFLVTVLARHRYRLLEAANGREGLAAARAGRVDLVIADVLMPEMDGYEFVRQLRLDPATAGVPVAFYTAHYGAREARALAQSVGVSDVLIKPATSVELLRVVSRLISGGPVAEAPPDCQEPATRFDREHLRLLTDKLSGNTTDLRRANARLRALINIGLELAGEPDADRLLQRVGDAARDLFGATYVSLGIVDPAGTVRRVVTCGPSGAPWVKIGDGLSGVLRTVVFDRRTCRGDSPGDDAARLPLAPHSDVQAFLAVPIASPNEVYGWICLVGNEGRAFAEDDEDLVQALAGHVGRIYELEHVMRERQQAESALRQVQDLGRAAEERMRFALNNADVGMWDWDVASGRLQWSETLERQYGLQPGTFGGTFDAFLDRIHPEDRESVREAIGQAMTSGADFSFVNRVTWPDGTVRWLSGAGRIFLGERADPVRGVGMSQDVTQFRSLEERYRQAQKMETVGRLTGGVAHDFNNLLTVILGYCDILCADLGSTEPHHADVVEIQKAGTRGLALTRQLLAFSRKQVNHSALFDLNVVIGDLQSMLERLIMTGVTIELRLAPGPSLVLADRGEVEQVVMNLAVNARDAMPNGGTLTVETANVELDGHETHARQDVPAGSYVRLTVTDTGTGITPEVLAHLFEAFFTTKAPGKGTGLGLATVHGIVTRCGGFVDVDSQVGTGTSFTLFFPRSRAGAPAIQRAACRE